MNLDITYCISTYPILIYAVRSLLIIPSPVSLYRFPLSQDSHLLYLSQTWDAVISTNITAMRKHPQAELRKFQR